MASWLCPFCNHLSTAEAMVKETSDHTIRETFVGLANCSLSSYLCPNPQCKQFVLKATFYKIEGIGSTRTYMPQESWTLRPQGAFKTFPNYIPAPILADYKEACLIKELSPKASATLSRRCLQGMIRDFWSVKEKNLFEEINAIKEKIPSDVWESIDAVRQIGNIGAHMEKDIDLIIEVNPDEAELLIQLIESLLRDWYIDREQRKQRTSAIIAAAQAKKEQKNK
ncbi:DUF4145 domain-containing protein [Rahnella aceris]|uniref:DUF4145 domain-containing protein n=1 Tax=Rahnella sp. (strain Y9602) TaxID=2703885 RepID=UPI0019042563|nr:DUF4145 domain-containing protein [Rahnella aceris]QQN36624.1 DUF4145 domain-containing protein [Rahnella aceris]